jgi:hypothetical protein
MRVRPRQDSNPVMHALMIWIHAVVSLSVCGIYPNHTVRVPFKPWYLERLFRYYKEGAARRLPNNLQQPSFTQSSSTLQASLTNNMPSLKALFSILALGALSTTAAPAGKFNDVTHVEAGNVMARQQVSSVGACKDIDWKGQCRRFDIPVGTCCKSKLGLLTVLSL